MMIPVITAATVVAMLMFSNGSSSSSANIYMYIQVAANVIGRKVGVACATAIKNVLLYELNNARPDALINYCGSRWYAETAYEHASRLRTQARRDCGHTCTVCRDCGHTCTVCYRLLPEVCRDCGALLLSVSRSEFERGVVHLRCELVVRTSA